MGIVAPSILAADFTRLGEALSQIKDSGSSYVHFDVMDGNFVPNISFGLNVLADVRRATDLILDVHLMIDRPVRYVEQFCDTGADIVTIHVEADTVENNRLALAQIKAKGKKAAVSLKPGTPVSSLAPYWDLCDMILVMTVEPGFGGQSFQPEMMEKLTEISQYIENNNLDCLLEVDGGINQQTAETCKESGANVFVAGSAFFKAADKKAFVESLSR